MTDAGKNEDIDLKYTLLSNRHHSPYSFLVYEIPRERKPTSRKKASLHPLPGLVAFHQVPTTTTGRPSTFPVRWITRASSGT